MPELPREQTVFVSKSRGASIVDRATTGLPPDLLNRIAIRLQILAWLYAFTLVLSCLAKDREQRPNSPRDLLQRLDAIAVRHQWSEERAREWWRTHLPQ